MLLNSILWLTLPDLQCTTSRVRCTGYATRDNLQHWLGDFARLLKVQFTSTEGMSDDAPIHECESEIDHYTGHYMPYSL